MQKELKIGNFNELTSEQLDSVDGGGLWSAFANGFVSGFKMGSKAGGKVGIGVGIAAGTAMFAHHFITN